MFLELKNNFLSVGKRRIDTLIDQARVNIFSVETDGLFFDYSKTNIAVSYTHLTLPTIYSV